ncbi:MAG: methyltransferase [Clostridiales bacterium]|nr:methyltransferase [Clostridiales bacterium]
MEAEHLEPLSRDYSVIVSQSHRFNTDTILLAAFSTPRTGDLCADLGTGCGAIPLIWCARAKPRKIYALEIQEEACAMARRSVEYNRLSEMVEVVHGDICEIKKYGLPAGGFDTVACNPPYKINGTGIHNPAEALRVARHETACRFEDIAKAAAHLLRFGGRFFCCMRPERLCGAMLDLRNAGLEPKRLRFVQQRPDRPPFLFLLQANRGGKPGLTVDPVLFIEGSNGFSEEMQQIYGEYTLNKGASGK